MSYNPDYQKQYYKDNRDKILQRSKDRHAKKRNEINRQKRERYQETKTERLKQTNEDRRQHKDKYKEYMFNHRKKNVFSWFPFIRSLGYEIVCKKCGYCHNFRCIEFHHRDPSQKKHNIANLLRNKPTPEREKVLKEELEKCDIYCNRCHGELHSPTYIIDIP